MSPRVSCLHFSGSRPCGYNTVCDKNCTQYKERGEQILLIHLGALGAVVRSTALLRAIHRKYPGSQITWVTQNPAHQLLQNHPQIHRVFTLNETSLLSLSVLEFDVAFVIDKSIEAAGILKRTNVKQVFGFNANSFGVIEPVNEAAQELWHIGLSDELKFKVNNKTELELIRQALELDQINDEYNLPLTRAEKELSYQRRMQWSQNQKKTVIGLNTGCAATIAAKKLSVQNHRELIRLLQKNDEFSVVLLGGPEDTERNFEIAKDFHHVFISPTTLGLRDGLVSVSACDLVITGDSLGMHMAISQNKHVIAWFGPTCAHEIDLYDRGQKILSQASCGPCWKRTCHKPVMCYDLVNLDEIIQAAESFTASRKNQIESGDSNRLFGRSSVSNATFVLDEKNSSADTLGDYLP